MSATSEVRERLEAWASDGFIGRERLMEAWSVLDRLDARVQDADGRSEAKSARINWLETELRAREGTGALKSIEGVLRAGSEALMRQRHAELDRQRARTMLDDAELAVTIDSLATMRDQMRKDGIDAPNVERALAKFKAMTAPDVTTTEVTV